MYHHKDIIIIYQFFERFEGGNIPTMTRAKASTRCSASNGMSVVDGSGRPTVSSDVTDQ